MTDLTQPLAVRVVGVVRGQRVDAMAEIALDHDAVVLNWPDAAAWRLAFDGIEGLAPGAGALTLYLRDHDVLELTGAEALRPFALLAMDRLCVLPELTRGLRGFGAPGTRGGASGAVGGSAGAASPAGGTLVQSAHDLWFGPLLAARRAAHGVTDPARQVALMDGSALADAMMEAAARIAALLAPGDSAEQRAVEAAIEDDAAVLFRALERLRHAGETVRTGSADTRLANWRRWVTAARAVFAAADDAWPAIVDIVADR